MLERISVPDLPKTFPEIVAVYLFGSALERPEQARDGNLAVFVRPPGKDLVSLYLALYLRLAEIFTPLEVLFLNSASLPVCFEAIKRLFTARMRQAGPTSRTLFPAASWIAGTTRKPSGASYSRR